MVRAAALFSPRAPRSLSVRWGPRPCTVYRQVYYATLQPCLVRPGAIRFSTGVCFGFCSVWLGRVGRAFFLLGPVTCVLCKKLCVAPFASGTYCTCTSVAPESLQVLYVPRALYVPWYILMLLKDTGRGRMRTGRDTQNADWTCTCIYYSSTVCAYIMYILIYIYTTLLLI